MGGRDHDERALALGQRVPRVLGQQERARQQDREDLVPAVLGELAHGRDVLDAGVGDHEVETAERLQRRVDGAGVALTGRQVGGEVGVVQVDAEDVVAVRAQAVGGGAADAGGGTGDERGGHAASPTRGRARPDVPAVRPTRRRPRPSSSSRPSAARA